MRSSSLSLLSLSSASTMIPSLLIATVCQLLSTNFVLSIPIHNIDAIRLRQFVENDEALPHSEENLINYLTQRQQINSEHKEKAQPVAENLDFLLENADVYTEMARQLDKLNSPSNQLFSFYPYYNNDNVDNNNKLLPLDNNNDNDNKQNSRTKIESDMPLTNGSNSDRTRQNILSTSDNFDLSRSKKFFTDGGLESSGKYLRNFESHKRGNLLRLAHNTARGFGK